MCIDEIGEKMALSLTHYFSLPETIELIDRLTAYGVNMTSAQTVQTGGVLQGKTLVVTGTLVNYSRESIKAVIEENGGKAAGSVSAKTDYVVVGENAGSKAEKAVQLGVQILTEEAFAALIQNHKEQ